MVRFEAKPEQALFPANSMADSTHDNVQRRLDSVTRRLERPSFLRLISTSRLPSQAASETSLSPKELSESIASRLARPLEAHNSNQDLSHEHDAYLACNILAGDATHEDPVPDKEKEQYKRLQRNFLGGWKSLKTMATFQHGHHDSILACDFNFYGTRMVSASVDHQLKVWDRKEDIWTVTDSWKAHDAEIVDVKWNGPFMGEVIGSIGEDGRFKLWEEDLTEMPGSHHRFRLIMTLLSETRVPFMSLDFKNVLSETYVALITRDGFLSVYEPINHDNLSEWQVLMQQYICATPSRQEETGFRVCFHREMNPAWPAVQAGLDSKSLSIAVASMMTVKILRTDKDRKFYLAAELEGARNIVRDVAWANGSMRGYDVIATASKDGVIRVYELHTPDRKAISQQPNPSEAEAIPDQANLDALKHPPSAITAALANPTNNGASAADITKSNVAAGRIMQVPKLVAELNPHVGAAWRVAFSQQGKLEELYAWVLLMDYRGSPSINGGRYGHEDVEEGFNGDMERVRYSWSGGRWRGRLMINGIDYDLKC